MAFIVLRAEEKQRLSDILTSNPHARIVHLRPGLATHKVPDSEYVIFIAPYGTMAIDSSAVYEELVRKGDAPPEDTQEKLAELRAMLDEVGKRGIDEHQRQALLPLLQDAAKLEKLMQMKAAYETGEVVTECSYLPATLITIGMVKRDRAKEAQDIAAKKADFEDRIAKTKANIIGYPEARVRAEIEKAQTEYAAKSEAAKQAQANEEDRDWHYYIEVVRKGFSREIYPIKILKTPQSQTLFGKDTALSESVNAPIKEAIETCNLEHPTVPELHIPLDRFTISRPWAFSAIEQIEGIVKFDRAYTMRVFDGLIFPDVSSSQVKVFIAKLLQKLLGDTKIPASFEEQAKLLAKKLEYTQLSPADKTDLKELWDILKDTVTKKAYKSPQVANPTLKGPQADFLAQLDSQAPGCGKILVPLGTSYANIPVAPVVIVIHQPGNTGKANLLNPYTMKIVSMHYAKEVVIGKFGKDFYIQTKFPGDLVGRFKIEDSNPSDGVAEAKAALAKVTAEGNQPMMKALAMSVKALEEKAKAMPFKPTRDENLPQKLVYAPLEEAVKYYNKLHPDATLPRSFIALSYEEVQGICTEAGKSFMWPEIAQWTNTNIMAINNGQIVIAAEHSPLMAEASAAAFHA